MATLRLIPKWNKSEVCFITAVSSQQELHKKTGICVNWAEENSALVFGVYGMNYGNRVAELENTMFFIFRFKTTKLIEEAKQKLIKDMESIKLLNLESDKRKIKDVIEALNTYTKS